MRACQSLRILGLCSEMDLHRACASRQSLDSVCWLSLSFPMLTAVIPPQNQDILDMVLDGKDLCALRVPTSNGESSLEIMEFDELVRYLELRDTWRTFMHCCS